MAVERRGRGPWVGGLTTRSAVPEDEPAVAPGPGQPLVPSPRRAAGQIPRLDRQRRFAVVARRCAQLVQSWSPRSAATGRNLPAAPGILLTGAGILLAGGVLALALALSGPDHRAALSNEPGPGVVTGEVARSVATIGIAEISPDPSTYGAGMTIRVRFDQPVPDAARSAVTERIAVTASKDIGPAGWAWSDPSTAVFRPRDFWPGHTKVTIRAQPAQGPIARVKLLAAYGQPGPAQRLVDTTDLMWSGQVDQSFRIGRSQVITVVSDTHRATVRRDGRLVRIMKTSLGKPGWETRTGIKVMTERFRVKTMTSGSIGAEDNYSLEVPFAIRLTDSGEFIHAAPWAEGRIGSANGSHGCTNLLLDDAEWLFDNALYGDPVITHGTGRKMEPGNGLGGVWNVPWSKWEAGSATG